MDDKQLNDETVTHLIKNYSLSNGESLNLAQYIQQLLVKEITAVLERLEAIANKYGKSWIEQMGIEEMRQAIESEKNKLKGEE